MDDESLMVFLDLASSLVLDTRPDIPRPVKIMYISDQ